MSKIGIVHLTDIHFSPAYKEDFSEKISSVKKAINDDFSDCKRVFIVISGDIAWSGKKEEYDLGKVLLKELRESLDESYNGKITKLVLVPGNHDCNFDCHDQLRENQIENMDYCTIGKDHSVIEKCLEVQSDFWQFFAEFLNTPKNRLYFTYEEKLEGKRICFHCINTSWISKKNELPGSLFFPVKHIKNLERFDKDSSLDISIYHHPENWFSPKLGENNKKEFQTFIEEISSIQLVGHEHANELRRTENLDSKNSSSLKFSGELFFCKEKDKSGFQTLLIDLDTLKLNINRYCWEEKMYKRKSENKEFLVKKKHKRFANINESFLEIINKVNIPLTFDRDDEKLEGLFISPELEEIEAGSEQNDFINGYIDSKDLLKDEGVGYLFEGENQSGKTSLLYMYFLDFFEEGKYPIFLKGDEIITDDIVRLTEKFFDRQYDSPETFEKYRQLEKSQKILLVDDFQKGSISWKRKKKLLEKALDFFGKVIITMDTEYSILPEVQADFKGIRVFKIMPLGYKKRNDLIEKYLVSQGYEKEVELLDRTKNMFEQIDQILGNQLIPAYPFFILSILQALEQRSFNLDQTSYGYCYQSLIHLALKNAGIKRDDVDSYFNFLTELAFFMYKEGKEKLTEEEFGKFYAQYRREFILPSFEIISRKLLKSKILQVINHKFSFCLKYMLYFLIAKKNAVMINEDLGEQLVEELFENMHKEENANILVFITYHTQNKNFIENSLLPAMVSFDQKKPITLDKDCEYYQLISAILEDIVDNVLRINQGPSEERKKLLEEKDKASRQQKMGKPDEDFEVNEKVIPLIKSFRSMEILGQIVKNRKGSLQKAFLKDIIEELYNNSFRMANYLGDLIKEAREYIAYEIEEKLPEDFSRGELEKRVNKFLHFYSLQLCLAIFSKLIYSVGVRELREVYSVVAEKINSPAAKIVSFSINSYYGKIDIDDLKKLIDEFKDNPVAFQLLKSRVKSYVNYNYVNFREKQRIADYMGMNIYPKLERQKNK